MSFTFSILILLICSVFSQKQSFINGFDCFCDEKSVNGTMFEGTFQDWIGIWTDYSNLYEGVITSCDDENGFNFNCEVCFFF